MTHSIPSDIIKEVGRLIRKGERNKEIAEFLGLKQQTVSYYRRTMGAGSPSSILAPKIIADVYKMGNIMKKDFGKKPTTEYFAELCRVSKNQIIWGANNFNIPPFKGFVVWRKLSIGETFTMSMCEIAALSESLATTSKYFEMIPQDPERIHPTQKPIALYDWLIVNYAKDCKNILDTHVGSGSSRIAAHKHGKEFIGFEIDKGYWDAQEKRYQQFIAQGTLF